MFVFAIATLVMDICGLVSTDGNAISGVTEIKGFTWAIDWTKLRLLIYSTIQYALFSKAPFFEAQGDTGTIILTLSTKLLLPIQATLFVVALRNKFRR